MFKPKILMAGAGVFALSLGMMLWNTAGTVVPDTAVQDFEPTAAPPEAIQRAWRLGDGKVQLQYTYTGPNICWKTEGLGELTFEPETALLTIVPKFAGKMCAPGLVPLNYNQVLDIPLDIEILIIRVDHPEGGNIERNELWIEPEEN